jgi:adenylate cyclase
MTKKKECHPSIQINLSALFEMTKQRRMSPINPYGLSTPFEMNRNEYPHLQFINPMWQFIPYAVAGASNTYDICAMKPLIVKKNSDILYAEFEKAIVSSEYQRTRLMMGAFSLGFLIVIVNYFLLGDKLIQYYGGVHNYFNVAIWLCLFIAYEFLVGKLINRYVRNKIGSSNAFKITHSLIEVSLVSMFIYYMVVVKDRIIYLDSPLYMLYYFFLILSVLHMDLKISILTGVAGAVQFSYITWYGFHISRPGETFIANTPESSYYVECMILIVSGAVAGYVAAQVKRSVKASLEVQLEKNQMEELFGQQVSQEVVHALVEDKGTLMKYEATVLAMDIRNFTNFAQQHTPDEIMDFQNKIFGPILDIIAEYDGVVNQIMGDGLMATFGILVPNPDHAKMAFHAALRIRQKVKELSEQGVIPATKIGLGIHTGEVVTGNIGNETRKQYSISGSAVIIAFRVEQLNKDLNSELLITGEVKTRIQVAKNQLAYLGQKIIKGFEHGMDVYQAA